MGQNNELALDLLVTISSSFSSLNREISVIKNSEIRERWAAEAGKPLSKIGNGISPKS